MTPADLDDVLQRVRRPWLRWALRRPLRPLLRLQVRRWARGIGGQLAVDRARQQWHEAMTSPSSTDLDRREADHALRLAIVHSTSDVEETRHALAALLEEDPAAHAPVPAVCSTCGQPMTAPACSLNRELGWSGHTVAGNGGRPAVNR